MSGFQFVHVESYSRKANANGQSTAFVFSEAARSPGACEHVENPGEPVTVFGESVDGVRALHDQRAEVAVCMVKGGKTRRVRQDQHTLMTIVASHPATPDEVRDDPAVRAEVDAWQARTVDWLRETWGDAVVSVIRHDDEGHVHLHAYALPGDDEMRARLLHPGVAAKDRAKADALAAGHDPKAANKVGDDAYKAAMRGMQDSYFDQVGVPSGLARLGPGRRRLDRAGWRAEQAQVEHAAKAIAAADQATTDAKDLADKGRAFVAKARAAHADALAGAKAAKAQADAADNRRRLAEQAEAAARQRAAGTVKAARREAAGILQGARAEADRLRSWGERLGGVWSGLSGVQRRLEQRAAERVKQAEEAARQKVAGALEAARGEVRGELGEARRGAAEATRRAQEAERRAREAEAARQEAERRAAAERAGRQAAEREREVFRGRWADADNKVIAMERGRRR